MLPKGRADKKLVVDPQPIIKKKALKPPMKGKPKNLRELKILPSKPGAPKPIISQGGIGNKEVQPVYRNQGIF
jgi:hypothetical protein